MNQRLSRGKVCHPSIAEYTIQRHITGFPESGAGIVKTKLRSSIALLATACFALSAITWGSMPGCARTADQPGVHGEHGTGHSHDKASDPAHRPAATQCVVHLCCAQAGTPARDMSSHVRTAVAELTVASAPLTHFFLTRSAHVLPFAHAPPFSA